MKTLRYAFAVLTLLAFAQNASATDARQAIRLCEKNPKCSFRVNDNGSVDITVVNPGGNSHINCPQEGECTCDICIRPAPGNTGGTRVTTPGKVLLR